MALTLEEAMKQKEQNVDVMPKNITMQQATEIDDINSIYEFLKYKDNPLKSFAKGLYNALDTTKDIIPSVELYGRNIDLAIGGYFGADEEQVQRKQLNIATIQRNLVASQKERYKYSLPETTDSLAFGLGQGAANLLTMYASGGFAGGLAKNIAVKSAVGIATGAALENVEQQSERIPVNEQGNVDVEKITPEWAKKASIGTTAYLTTSALLEKYIGFGKQTTMWQTPIKFSNKTLKNMSPTLIQARNGLLSEGATEGIQSLASSGILLLEGTIKPSEMPERLQQAWKEAVIGGILGGSVGVAVGINQQNNVKKMLNEEISKVVADPQERENIVDAIWEAGTNEMTTVISKELELSSELNTKHGSIYDNMASAIAQAIADSGAFVKESETDIAQYVSETAKMFANQVLAEANKRGCYIDEVLKAGDIAYMDGKIQLKAGDKILAETPVIGDETVGKQNREALDIAYTLLSMATGKDKTYIKATLNAKSNNSSVRKRQEALEQMLAEADDKLDVQTIDPSWHEYFTFSDELGAENTQTLIEQALRIIDNGGLVARQETKDDYLANIINQAFKVYRETNDIDALENYVIEIVPEAEQADVLEYIYNKLAENKLFQSASSAGANENSLEVKITRDEYINPTQNILLPQINIDFTEIDKKSKPILLKKNIITKNKNHHSELDFEENNIILTNGLYKTDLILKTKENDNYYNFVYLNKEKNQQVLVEVSENKENFEIVGWQYISTKNLQNKINNAKKIKRTDDEVGQVLITKRENPQRAAVLSALDTSSVNIIPLSIVDLNPNVKVLEQSLDIPTVYYQAAYHGTPHKFDEFSLDAIGTGEGAQAHGWGLYFAENKDVSEGYREKLSVDKATYDGKPIPYIADIKNDMLINAVLNTGKERALEILRRRKQNDTTKKQIEYIENLDVTKLKREKGGQLFEVDIPENDVLLDENKTIKEQSEKVKEALKKLCREEGFNYLKVVSGFSNEMKPQTGKQIYNNLRNFIQWKAEENGNKISDDNSAKEASLLLNKYGIKGITYDGKQDGRCYVIFDDKAIKILNTYYQIKGLPRIEFRPGGMYYVSEKAIELTNLADYSTLPHELAHYWLDNMWAYTRTGKASSAYMNNFNAMADWLGIKEGQITITRKQHEKFARGYEKYLLQGYAPNGLIQGAFDDYDRWLKRVYVSAKQLKVKLSPAAIEFFNTMTTGELPEYTVEETQKEIWEKNLKEAEKTVEETKKVIIEKQAEFTGVSNNLNTKPVTSDGDIKKSAVFTNQARILGIAEQLNYNKVNIEEQNKKADEFINNNFEQAERIVKGLEEPPADILKNAIFNAYLRKMLEIGNNEAYLEVLRTQSLDLTRKGQEIASQRNAIENIFDPAYWIRKIETNAKTKLAVNKFGSMTDETGEIALSKMNEYIEREINSQIDAYLDATPEERTKIVEKLSKKITSEFGVKAPDKLYQSLYEPSEIRTRTNAYNYIYKVISGDLGISLTKEQANEVIAKTTQIQKAIERTKGRGGNPSVLFFKNLSELENFANSISPSPSLAVLTSTVGRGNMLFSPKSLALNIESNILNFLTEALIKRVVNGTNNLAVDPQVIKDYMAFSNEVYRASGYQLSSMPELDPTTKILSEKITTSQGEGVARALGRFFEQTIFKYGLGYPDLIFKDLAFTDTANLLATQYAKGDSKKATEIFKDVILVEPKTQIGKEIREIAINDALIATYQNKGTISKLALDIRNAINKGTKSLRLGDLLSPFVKTPANVIGLGLDYTFGGAYALWNVKTIINDFKNGELTDTSKKAMRSLSRNGLGLFVSFILASLIDDEDYIPDYALLSPKERELVKLKGGVYNSIKIGDKYYSLDYFGTLGLPLVSILNARRGKDLKEKVFKYVQGAGFQALKLPVVGDLKKLLENTGRTLNQDVDNNIKMLEDATIDFVSSRSIPAIVTDVAKMTDEYERDTQNKAFNRLMSKIPVLREQLPAQYNYGTGKAVETQDALSTLFAGARVKEEISNSVINEIDRLADENTETKITLSKVTKLGKLSTLNDSQKIAAEKEFAKQYSKEVKALISSYSYKNADDSKKVKMINKVRSKVVERLKRQYGLNKRSK